tara:strand:- start:6 stop:1220 length:1215 start_codon:yes stop_codon:yes gene_type:complete
VKNTLEKIYNYLGFLICLSIPYMTFANAFVNISMICLFVIFVAMHDKQKILEAIQNRYFKVFSIFLFFIILFTLFNSSFFVDFSETRKIAQIILLIILFSFINDKRFLIYGFISGVFISSLLSGLNIVNYYLNSFEFLMLKFSVEDLFVTQRLYLGFFIVISTILLSHIYQISKNKLQKYLSLFLIIYFLFMLFIISSRSALLIAFVVVLTTIIYQLKPLYGVLLVVGTAIIFSTIILTNKNLSSRFLYSEDLATSSFFDKIKIHEPRYDIWKFSTQIFKEEKPYFFGIGTFRTQELLISKYQSMPIEKRKNWFIERNFNTHNQYIDIILSYGIIGFLIFLIFLKEIVTFCHKNIHALNLVLSLILFLLIENVFHRQLGSFIFALTLVFALSIINLKNEKNISC